MKQIKKAKITSRRRKDPIKAAEDYGIDIPMPMANLNRSIAERFRRHQIALETYEILHKAKLVGPLDEMKKIRGKLMRVHTVDSLIYARRQLRKIKDIL